MIAGGVTPTTYGCYHSVSEAPKSCPQADNYYIDIGSTTEFIVVGRLHGMVAA